MLGVFKKLSTDSEHSGGLRATRHSRGWIEMNRFLRTREGLRVLDFGPTSPANITFLTELGHSVYMANAVADVAGPEWRKTDNADDPGSFDVDAFCRINLDFSGRTFDVILLWDTADFLPPQLAAPFFQRMQDVLQPGGRLLAFFHQKKDGADAVFSRYQLSDSDELTVLRTGGYPIEALLQVRHIERLLEKFTDLRFFVAKDNLRELFATR